MGDKEMTLEAINKEAVDLENIIPSTISEFVGSFHRLSKT
jgi:hypothetical protein